MVAIKVFFGSECRRSNHVPKTLNDLKEFLLSITSLQNPLIQYKDEEGDLISVYSEQEYQDLIDSSGQLIKIIVSPNGTEKINELPQVSKLNLISFQESSTFANKKLDNASDAKLNQNPYNKFTPQKQTNENNYMILSNIKKNDIEIPEANANDNAAKTKNFLLQSIRNVIREEIGKNDQLKLSGILITHNDIECTSCKTKPIVGIRYKCSECPTNFCEQCEFYEEHEHSFYKVKNNQEYEEPKPEPKPEPKKPVHTIMQKYVQEKILKAEEQKSSKDIPINAQVPKILQPHQVPKAPNCNEKPFIPYFPPKLSPNPMVLNMPENNAVKNVPKPNEKTIKFINPFPPKVPQGPQVFIGPQVPQVPTGPQIPQVPTGPQVPQGLKVPQVTNFPKALQDPQVPSYPFPNIPSNTKSIRCGVIDKKDSLSKPLVDPNEMYKSNIEALTRMGYSEKESLEALILTSNNLQNALEILIDG